MAASHTCPKTCAGFLAALFASAAFLSITASAGETAADWPNWRGPQRDGTSAEKGLKFDAPKVLWQKNVGAGFSAMSVVGGRAYTMGHTEGKDEEKVLCLEPRTGKELWAYAFKTEVGGPRSTPTVADGVVYTLNAKGIVNALNAETGAKIWSKDLGTELGLKSHRHGFSGSPVIDGDLLLLNVGKDGTALNKKTGQVIWTTGKEPAGFASPVPFALAGGRRGAMMFGSQGLTAVDLKDGKRLWHYKWQTRDDQNIADPIVDGDKVFISSGYYQGCAMLQFTADSVKEVWRNTSMRNYWVTCIYDKGKIYGFDNAHDQAGSRESFRCIAPPNRKELWVKPWPSFASLIMVDGKLVIVTDKGALLTVAASPDKYTELTRVQPKGLQLSGLCFTAPSLAGKLLFIRTDKGEAACLELQ